MTPDVVSGLSVIAIVTIAFCVLTPILTWVLPDRSTLKPQLNGASVPKA